MSANFPGSPHTMGFVHMRNTWGNPCISHMMKYTIGWKSNEESTHTKKKV